MNHLQTLCKKKLNKKTVYNLVLVFSQDFFIENWPNVILPFPTLVINLPIVSIHCYRLTDLLLSFSSLRKNQLFPSDYVTGHWSKWTLSSNQTMTQSKSKWQTSQLSTHFTTPLVPSYFNIKSRSINKVFFLSQHIIISLPLSF